jgi:hypothetical protein
MSKYQKRQYRLPGFNYASNDAYFVTINTTDRVHFFGEIKEGKMLLSEMGEVVVNELEMASIHKKNILISDYVVMPDHVHIIVGLQNKDISKGSELIKKNPAISGEIHSLQKESLPCDFYECVQVLAYFFYCFSCSKRKDSLSGSVYFLQIRQTLGNF